MQSESSLKQLLENMTRLRELNRSPKLGEYYCYEDFVLRHGVLMPYRPIGPNMKLGHMGFCYHNCGSLAVKKGSPYTYCEGYATGALGFPIGLHAWLLDQDGYVVDRTWPHEWMAGEPQYYGVPFTREYVSRCYREDQSFGVIDRWRQNWPLLTIGAEAEIAIHKEIRDGVGQRNTDR